MELIMPIVIGILYAGAVYMMMRRNIVQLILGLALLGYGTNLLIFSVAGLTRDRPPIIEAAKSQLSGTYADPLPQAMILTAIVISFAVLAFALVLAYRTYATLGTDDLVDLHEDMEH